jgi:hypothetical protein
MRTQPTKSFPGPFAGVVFLAAMGTSVIGIQRFVKFLIRAGLIRRNERPYRRSIRQNGLHADRSMRRDQRRPLTTHTFAGRLYHAINRDVLKS